ADGDPLTTVADTIAQAINNDSTGGYAAARSADGARLYISRLDGHTFTATPQTKDTAGNTLTTRGLTLGTQAVTTRKLTFSGTPGTGQIVYVGGVSTSLAKIGFEPAARNDVFLVDPSSTSATAFDVLANDTDLDDLSDS